MSKHGGHQRGVKLSLAQWREARTLYEDGVTIDRIAKRYGCAYSTAWHAIKRNAPPREVKEPQVGLMQRVDAYLRTTPGTEAAIVSLAACLE